MPARDLRFPKCQCCWWELYWPLVIHSSDVSSRHLFITQETRQIQVRQLCNSNWVLINTLPYVLFPQRQCFLLIKLSLFHLGGAPWLSLPQSCPTLMWAESLLSPQLIGQHVFVDTCAPRSWCPTAVHWSLARARSQGFVRRITIGCCHPCVAIKLHMIIHEGQSMKWGNVDYVVILKSTRTWFLSTVFINIHRFKQNQQIYCQNSLHAFFLACFTICLYNNKLKTWFAWQATW